MRKVAFCLLAALAQPAWAQVGDNDPGEDIVIYHPPADGFITVLATGRREPLAWSGVQVSVFDRDDIAAVQGADLTRLLERAPGATWSRNGGPGSYTGLRVRGSEGEQVLVLVDGVRLADPASPGGGFDLGTLALGSLAKVELQRGANSVLWGSQAMGGVLAVTSDLAAPPQLALEYGSRDRVHATATASHEAGPLDLGLAAGYQRSKGTSAAAIGSEPDGYRQVQVAARVRAHVNDAVSAFAMGRLADARLDTDGFPAPDYALADTAEFQDTRQVSAAFGLDGYWRDLELHAVYSQAATDRENYDPAFGVEPGYTTDGISRRAEVRGTWGGATDEWQVHFGIEYEWQSFASLFDARATTGAFAAFAQADYDADGLHLALGLRRDEHRQFGSEWNLGADAAYDLGGGWRATASYGEGFKAPSLFQLLSDYGNAALRPERARSYDAGLAWVGDEAWLALTAFRRDTRDQISFVSCSMDATGICADRPNGTYDNRDRTRAMGLEGEAGFSPADRLTLAVAYALVDTQDRTPGSATFGNVLARRPRHAATMTAQWEPVPGLMLAVDLRAVSRAWDDAGNSVALRGYRVVTVRGDFDLSDAVELFARIENLADAEYQTAAGYGQPGRSGWIGARWRL